MRRRSESPSKAAEVREPVCSERDIRVPERSEDGCPCRSEDDPALSHTSHSETTNILKTTRNRYYPQRYQGNTAEKGQYYP